MMFKTIDQTNFSDKVSNSRKPVLYSYLLEYHEYKEHLDILSELFSILGEKANIYLQSESSQTVCRKPGIPGDSSQEMRGIMEQQKKIIMTDEDYDVYELLTAVLPSNSFEVTPDFDGQKTMEFVFNERPDLVILDIIIPTRDGRDICRDLKKNTTTMTLKILIEIVDESLKGVVTKLEKETINHFKKAEEMLIWRNQVVSLQAA
jgi:CheY-like chemotaxis protein